MEKSVDSSHLPTDAATCKREQKPTEGSTAVGAVFLRSGAFQRISRESIYDIINFFFKSFKSTTGVSKMDPQRPIYPQRVRKKSFGLIWRMWWISEI